MDDFKALLDLDITKALGKLDSLGKKIEGWSKNKAISNLFSEKNLADVTKLQTALNSINTEKAKKQVAALLSGINKSGASNVTQKEQEVLIKNVSKLYKDLEADRIRGIKTRLQAETAYTRELEKQAKRVEKARSLRASRAEQRGTFVSASDVGLKGNTKSNILAVQDALEKIKSSKAGVEASKTLKTLENGGKVSEASLRKLQKSLIDIDSVGFGGKLRKSLFTVNGELQTFGQTLAITGSKIAFWGLMTTAIYGTLRAIKSLVAGIIEVDTSLIELRKVLKSSGAEEMTRNLNFARDTASKLGQELGISFKTATLTMRDFVRQGYSLADSAILTKNALMAVNIAGLEQAEATKYMISVMQQFKLSAKDTTKVLDSWNNIENTVGSTTRDMAEAVSRSGAAFRVVGGTFDELNALAVTAMKATGQSGEQIGTMLKSLSARYADVSKKQGAYNVLLKEAKISMKSTTGELKPITQTLGELSTKWDTLSKTQQANIAKAMAGQYHYSRFLSIMENWDGVLNTVTASLDSTNSALKENENFMNSIQKQIDVTNASFEQLSVTIQKNYGQSVVNGIKLLNTFIQGLSTQQAQIAILTTVLGTATLAMLVFGKAAATAALAFAATPIGLFVTALGLLTAGLAYYIKKQGEASVKIAESNQVTIQASDAIVAYEDKIQSLGNSLNVYASRYVYLKKEGKDTSKIIGDITKIIAGSEKPLTDSQKAMLDLALTTQDAGIRTKEFGRFVNSLKADNYINEINKIDTHLLSLFETYDMISTKATFFERILARIALKAQGKSDYEIDKIGTEINYEKVAEKGKMDAAIKRAQLAKAKIKKAMETPITITPQNFGTEDTDPYGGDKGKKGKSNLSDELNMRLNLLERVTEETDLYNKKLEELAKKEAILRITLAQSNKTYKESSQEKNIDLQRITLTVEKYNKLNNSIANVSAQKKKFLKENEKIIYSITKNRVSNQKLTEQQKKDLEVELESLKTKANNIETMTTERKALEAKAIVVKGIIEQNKIYEKTLEDQRKEIISTRESIVQLTEAYLNMADVADGTGQIVRDALKSGIKTALLSGFDSTAMLQGFNSAADSIKEKMADSISEGIIYGAYGGKDEFNRQVDQMANEVTKFFTGKSEKDAKGKELAKAVEQFKPIIEPVDNLTNSNVELKKSVDNLESTISKKSPKQDGGNKITGSARGNQLGQQYFNKYIKNKGSSGGFGVNISSFMPKGIDLSSMLPKEMSSMFSQVQSLFNQGMAAASQGGLAGAFTNQIAQQFGIYGDIGEGKKTAEASNIGGTVGGAIGSFIPIPGASMIGGAIGSLIGGIFGSDEDRKQQRRIKQAQDSISEYNRLLNVQSNTVDETHEKIAKLTDIVDKLKEAGQDASQYTDEIARLSSPEQTFKDRIETLQHDVNMTRDKNVANKKYLDGLIQLQKNFGNQLTLQSKRWLEETVFQLQQDVQITATVRSDDDLERLTKDVVKKISVTESLRGQSFVFI